MYICIYVYIAVFLRDFKANLFHSCELLSPSEKNIICKKVMKPRRYIFEFCLQCMQHEALAEYFFSPAEAWGWLAKLINICRRFSGEENSSSVGIDCCYAIEKYIDIAAPYLTKIYGRDKIYAILAAIPIRSLETNVASQRIIEKLNGLGLLKIDGNGGNGRGGGGRIIGNVPMNSAKPSNPFATQKK
jgi:hypothetical protein